MFSGERGRRRRRGRRADALPTPPGGLDRPSASVCPLLHRPAQVGKQLEEPVIAPQVGSARTELLMHVHEEGVSGQHELLTGVLEMP